MIKLKETMVQPFKIPFRLKIGEEMQRERDANDETSVKEAQSETVGWKNLDMKQKSIIISRGSD